MAAWEWWPAEAPHQESEGWTPWIPKSQRKKQRQDAPQPRIPLQQYYYNRRFGRQDQHYIQRTQEQWAKFECYCGKCALGRANDGPAQCRTCKAPRPQSGAGKGDGLARTFASAPGLPKILYGLYHKHAERDGTGEGTADEVDADMGGDAATVKREKLE